jgi:hypothetical protein
MDSDAFSSGGEEIELHKKQSQLSLYNFEHRLPRPNPIMAKDYSSK